MSTRCWMNVCFDGFLVWGLGCSCLRGFVFVVWLSSYSWWAVAWLSRGWFIRLLGGCGLRCCRASLLVVGVMITVGDWLVWVWVYKWVIGCE